MSHSHSYYDRHGHNDNDTPEHVDRTNYESGIRQTDTRNTGLTGESEPRPKIMAVNYMIKY